MRKDGLDVHWYITGRCNLTCGYCFGPKAEEEVEVRNVRIANALASSEVRSVILGGGEPLLVKKLDRIIAPLHDAKIYIGMHTNGIGLERRFGELGNLDEICLPVDSADREIQERLRGKLFLRTFDSLGELSQMIQESGMRLGFHTVFTEANYRGLKSLYQKLRRIGFDDWRIYEFNIPLAVKRVFASENRNSVLERRLREIAELSGGGTEEKGFTDCLFAYFLEAEAKFPKDRRVRFVAMRDPAKPYVFVDSVGNVSYYDWISTDKRPVVGNVLTDGIEKIRERVREINENFLGENCERDEEFAAADGGELPPWAQLRDGNLPWGELDGIHPKVVERMWRLGELYWKRREKIDRKRAKTIV